jgi:hypothetical protein
MLEPRLALAQWFVTHKPVDETFLPLRHVNRDPIWSYWDEPRIESWPEIIRHCEISQRSHGGKRLIRLSDFTLRDYLDIPDWVTDKRKNFSKTFFSDLLRLMLLRAYGGTWLDATVMISGSAGIRPHEGMFFAYSRPGDPALLSSWFLSASTDSHIVKSLLSSLLAYWRDFPNQSSYFDFHYLFEILYFTDSTFRAEWRDSVMLSHLPPHALQSVLDDKFDAATLQAIFAASDVHKLTYKLPAGVRLRRSNFYHYLCSSHQEIDQ